MSEANKAIVRRYFEEVWNKRDQAVIDEIAASGYVDHDPCNPGIRGPAGLRLLAEKYQSAFPDLHFTIEDQIAEGDRVATRVTWRGTHKGTLEGIAPTGKAVSGTALLISRISGEKLQEDWVNWDALGLMQQLGVVPAARAAS